MLFKNITIIDKDLNVKENMYVGIKGDVIDYISTEEPKESYGEIYEGRGRLLMSGFFNAHGHSPMMLLRGYGENMALNDWLFKKVFPFEDQLTNAAVYNGTLLAMAESLKYGIVSTSDMYYFCEDMAKAVAESGAKANISRSISNFDDSDLFDMERGQEMKYFVENYHNICDGRILVDTSLHSEYTTTPKTVLQLAEYTKEVGLNMHVHVSETLNEHKECIEKYGLTPVKYLNQYGLFDTKTIAAHCVHIEGEDFDILKDKGVTVACNPISNLKLSSGVCNVPKLLDLGINVAIGTDSVASNNSLNFFEEMKAFATVPKMMFNDPTAVTPFDTIKAATVNGAIAQGRDNTGVLEVGKKADLIVVDTAQPNMHPVHNMLNNLVYSSPEVILTMVDGKVLYDNGEYKTIDIEKTIFEVERCTQDILSKL